MSYHVAYRPKSFKTFRGNADVVERLQGLLEHPDKMAHAYLFVGSPGCGKTTLARIMAKKIGAEADDVSEMNTANVRGIDTIREVIVNAGYGNMFGGAKVFIFDEAHQLTNDAQNALLKILEDAPSHVYFFLCTTNVEKLLQTVKDRCVRFDLKPLRNNEASELFDYVAGKEDLEFDDDYKKAIIKYSDGSPRRILVNMYRCKGLSMKQGIALLENSVEGVKDEVVDIAKMFFEPKKLKWVEVMDKLNNLLKEDSAESVRRMMFAFFASTLRKTKTNDRVVYYTAILEVLDRPLLDGAQGVNSLVYLLGKLVSGVI